MQHLPTSDFLRDLARRVGSDYDSMRLGGIADVIDGMDDATRIRLDPVAQPAPGSTTVVSGATITHRPDVALAARTDAQRQAAIQGEPGYLPVKRAQAQPAEPCRNRNDDSLA